jgi:hypothetical protein
MTQITTWKKEIEEELENNGETWSDIIYNTLDDEEVLKEFDCGYGGTEGLPFTAWTSKRVYFPICYDGAEWCSSVPRDPCSERTRHKGGG